MTTETNTKATFVIFFIFLVLLGFITKLYSGPGQMWISYHFNAVIVVLAWCLVIALVLPELKNSRIALIAFAIMCGVEIYHVLIPAHLSMLREELLFPQLVDAQGSWNKIPFYGISAFLGIRLLNFYKE